MTYIISTLLRKSLMEQQLGIGSTSDWGRANLGFDHPTDAKPEAEQHFRGSLT
jgi:hypothetical protein